MFVLVLNIHRGPKVEFLEIFMVSYDERFLFDRVE
jgi:hypothetical protein